MTLSLSKPILYLITPGVTTEATTPASEEFQTLLQQISAAVAAGIQLIQIREKQLTARVLFELAGAVAAIASGTGTRILVNDRADIAAAGGADGVHLTTRSVAPDIIRKTFGAKFLIGASTHSLTEARNAFGQGADFAVFGPIFPSPSKAKYGSPLGTQKLADAARDLSQFPLLALGGISLENVNECFVAGARGVAAITLFGASNELANTVAKINDLAKIQFGTSPLFND